ncbi:MAG: TIGR03663 family protein [Candidatus Diapherotrites archaeon]
MQLEEKKILFLTLFFFFISFGVRLSLMELRPLHHDEGVNGYFISNIVEGRGWKYDPENYHGPTFFYITAVSFLAFGGNIFALRIVPVIFGCLLVLVPFLLRKRLGFWGVLTSTFFLAFSPALLYYSMDAIHEILFTFFMTASLVLFLEFASEKKPWMLFGGSACLAMFLATKEAAFIIGPFIVILAIFFSFAKEKKTENKLEGKKIAFLIEFLVAIAIFFSIYIPLFTSFFQNWNGLEDSVKTLGLWGPRVIVEKGHDKPFPYYSGLLLFSELPLLVAGIAGMLLAFWKRNVYFCVIGVFFIAMFLGVSAVPYKTPWIAINFLPPLALLSGFTAREFFGVKTGLSRQAGLLVLGVVFALVLWQSYYVNVVAPAAERSEENPWVYVQTTMSAKKAFERALAADGKILIALENESTWPMPWLLREKKVEYHGRDSLESAEFLHGFEVLIVHRNLGEIVVGKIPEYERFGFDLRPGVPLDAFFAQKKQNP